MQKRNIGYIIIISGYLLSFLLYFVLDEKNTTPFHSSDVFYVVGLPIMVFGLGYLHTINNTVKIRTFYKILLILITIIWIFGVILMIITK